MPQCKKCGKKGLFLKIEGDTGLCLACNERFAQEGKILTQKIIEAKNEATATKDAKKLVSLCKSIEAHGNDLVALQPSQELLDLIGTYKKMREQAEK